MSDKGSEALAQAVVLLERQHMLIEHLIKTNSFALKDTESAIEANNQSISHVFNVYNYVFLLIDHLVRYQKITAVLPKFNKKRHEFRAFNKNMGTLKDIRNQIQHINNDIENSFSGPLLGTICWAAGNSSYIASFHDIGRKRSSYGLIYDSHQDKYTSEFCYVYNDTYHDLGKAIQAVRTFSEFIRSSVHIEIDGKQFEADKHFVAVRMQFSRQNNSNAATSNDPSPT